MQVKLRNPLRTRATPERFCGGDSLRRGATSSVDLCTFTITFCKFTAEFNSEGILKIGQHLPEGLYLACSHRYTTGISLTQLIYQTNNHSEGFDACRSENETPCNVN